MKLQNIIMMTLLGIFIVDGKTSDVFGEDTSGGGMTNAGVPVSYAYYLDLRERMDHLDDQIGKTDKQVGEMKEKIIGIESSLDAWNDHFDTQVENEGLKLTREIAKNIDSKSESRTDKLVTKLENVGLRFSIEIREQLAAHMKEMKLLMKHEQKSENNQLKLGLDTHQHNSLDIIDRLDNVTITMEAMKEEIMNKLERDVLTAASRLDDKLYSLSQKSDICVRSALERRKTNCTDTSTSDLQGAPASTWITILRRMDGRVNFTRNWADYKSGFRDLGAEFWLGLEDIHQLTAVRNYRLRVVLTDFSGEVKFAEYSQFYIRGEADNYRLHVMGYVPGSTAGDSLSNHNNMEFTTFDNDNDKHDRNCAAMYKGGWWYGGCHSVNPTGLYVRANINGTYGINWKLAYNDRRSFKRLEMSIRHG